VVNKNEIWLFLYCTHKSTVAKLFINHFSVHSEHSLGQTLDCPAQAGTGYLTRLRPQEWFKNCTPSTPDYSKITEIFADTLIFPPALLCMCYGCWTSKVQVQGHFIWQLASAYIPTVPCSAAFSAIPIGRGWGSTRFNSLQLIRGFYSSYLEAQVIYTFGTETRLTSNTSAIYYTSKSMRID